MRDESKRGRAWMTLAVLCATLVAAVAAANTSAQGQEIVIGAAIAKSGVIAQFDTQAYQSMLLYIDQVNKAGGVNGRKIKVLLSDTHSNISRTPQVARGLISRGAQIMIVSCDFDFGAPAALVAQRAGLASFTLCATSPKFGVQGIGDKAYDVNVAGGTLGAVLAGFARQRGLRNAYVLTDRSIVAMQTQCNAFREAYPKVGGKIVGTDTMLNSDSSIAPQITRLRAKNPGFLVMCSYPPGGALALRQLRGAGVNIPILATDGMDGTAWVRSVPNISNFYITAHASIFGGSKQIDNYLKRYKARHKKTPTGGFAVTGYALGQTIVEALKRTRGDADGDAMKAVLDKFKNFRTIEGPVTFTPTVHIQLNRPLPIIRFTNGKPRYVTTVKPAIQVKLTTGAK